MPYLEIMQCYRIILSSLFVILLSAGIACGGDAPGTNRGSGGAGGNLGTGGLSGTGGNLGTGGVLGTGGATGTGGNLGTGGSTGTGGAGGIVAGCFPALCPDGNSYGCGDCIDNDGDGLVDDQDPECLGPCDGTEGPILLTGTPGQTGNQCGADCYFDRGNGSGSGECKWDRRCDPLEPKDGCTYDETLIGASNYCPDTQPALCESGCGQLTPNGCDCFGCCTFPELNGGYVFLGSYMGNEGTCTLADLSNPDLCRPCTPAGNCLNTCERCEICLGKPTIPADCFGGTGGSSGSGGTSGSGGASGTGGSGGSSGSLRCPVGKQECGLPGDAPCPAGTFCLTGCCTNAVQ